MAHVVDIPPHGRLVRICSSYIANTIAANVLVTQGAKASAAITLS